MKGHSGSRTRRLVVGQALIVALIVMGVLLILGFVFLGIINRNILQTGVSRRRSQATELALAGVRYAHSQLLNSLSAADWRPTPTQLAPAGVFFTKDPDVDYLRPGSGRGWRNAADTQIDQGGPDGLGPYSRLSFPGGRALIRVRYGPSENNLFQASPTGALRQPGLVRNYTIIEAIGRVGDINPSDPTSISSPQAVQFTGYTTDAQFRTAQNIISAQENLVTNTKSLMAFASCGTIEHALYVTDKDKTDKEAQIGFDENLGASFDTTPVIGTLAFGGSIAGPAGNTYMGFGDIFSNAPLRFVGNVSTILNKTMGDRISCASTITGDPATQLTALIKKDDESVTADDLLVQMTLTGGLVNGVAQPISLDSLNPNFWTATGEIRDGVNQVDKDMWSRSMAYVAPPTIASTDPNTGLNRYVQMSRDSGAIIAQGNTGRFGYGRNVYVDNFNDIQLSTDENGRIQAGSAESLMYDWLNPNNGQLTSAWQGPYYVPPGAYVLLNTDGFSITRDARSPANEKTWKNPDGTDTGSTTIRYRIGGDPDGLGPRPPYIINSFTPGANFNAAAPNWTAGVPFDGVLFFEGNVRIRGTIPTDVQLHVVSMGCIYIEGAITKGVNDPITGQRLNRASRSMLALSARQYVTLNTTQFFGPLPSQALSEVAASGAPIDWNPLRLAASNGGLTLWQDLLLDPNSGANPQLQTTYAENYKEFVAPGNNNGPIEDSKLYLSQATDNGPAPFSFILGDINKGTPNSSYLFPLDTYNAATQFYPAMESETFPLFRPAFVTVGGGGNTITENSPEGKYTFQVPGLNTISLATTNIGFGSTNDYILGRAAIIPQDIRIEASIDAEDGAFFVIPGNWYNPNPNDRRDTYMALGTDQASRDQARLTKYGSFPEMPFYGEPLDVKITILGAVTENMPPPMSQQKEWQKKWGWIPREHGISGHLIPYSHVPPGYNIATTDLYVPNLSIILDPALVTGRVSGFQDTPANPYVRVDNFGRALPPVPRLPVSPTLAYFGEVHP